MIRWVITFLLSCVVVVVFAIELRFSLKYLFQQITMSEKLSVKKLFWLESGLNFMAGMALIGILLLWNPLAKDLLDVLLIFNAVISLLLGESLVSPIRLSHWWKGAQDRKRKR